MLKHLIRLIKMELWKARIFIIFIALSPNACLYPNPCEVCTNGRCLRYIRPGCYPPKTTTPKPPRDATPKTTDVTCPSTTSVHVTDCSNQCLVEDCHGSCPSPENCLKCLEAAAPTQCAIFIPVR